eukprot:GILK01001828.1.p1 GENE.GILK01001828.1~~GILK01001828.1.p1  ORF type:complete len:371 (+),score=51.01 GILK01001828.1:48-1160(+)
MLSQPLAYQAALEVSVGQDEFGAPRSQRRNIFPLSRKAKVAAIMITMFSIGTAVTVGYFYFRDAHVLANDDDAERTLITVVNNPTIPFIGDWGREGNKNQKKVAKAIAEYCQKATTGCPHVVSVGDNFYDNGVVSVNDAQWQTSFEQVYDADVFNTTRWLAVLGNHDHRKGNYQSQIDYSLSHSKWHMPSRYFYESIVSGSVQVDFFFLDTNALVKEYMTSDEFKGFESNLPTPEQLDWVDSALANSTAQWKVVVGHHPIYSRGENGDTHDLQDDLLPLLIKHNVAAYIAGHDHNLQYIREKQKGDYVFHQFVSGAGSDTDKQKSKCHHEKCWLYHDPGFLAMEMQVDKLTFSFVDEDGQKVYGYEMLKK